MSRLEDYIRQVHDYKPLFRSRLPKGEIFGSSRSAPRLDSNRTNRILIYPGSFNPPHRGHMQLLKHVFFHGCHDLNVIAAIILPRSDSSVLSKCKEAGGTFMFGKNERCVLWKQDIAFPEWAWVYEGDDFSAFQERLKGVIKDDGYRTDFVMLYGPDIASPNCPPTGSYSCETMIMSNAARNAYYQRASGHLKDFIHCTRWRPFHVNKETLEHWAGLKAIHRLLDMHTICPKEALRMLEDGPEYVVSTINENVANAMEDLGQGNVLYCRRELGDRSLTIRFVKGEDAGFRGAKEISSSKVRAVMQIQHRSCQREALELMALSTHILWRYRSIWVEKVRHGASECISFPPVFEDNSCLIYNLWEDSENESGDNPEGRNDLGRKRQCLWATRQGASSIMEFPPACKDDLDLDELESGAHQKQSKTRRHSW